LSKYYCYALRKLLGDIDILENQKSVIWEAG